MLNDLRYAVRMLLKSPGFTAVAVISLAVGIGGTTAVFSVANKVLLNPIPGRDTDRLVTLWEMDLMHDARWGVSPPLIEELAADSSVIESLTYCFQLPEEKKFKIDARTVKLRGAAVAPNFFELLELRPLAGRTFRPGDGTQGTQPTIIISQGLWQQYFGGDSQLVGRSIELDGTLHLVVGIMPASVQFPFGSGDSQFWIPREFTSAQINSRSASQHRYWMVLARLRKGVGMSQLQSLLETIAARRAQSVNEPNERWAIQAKPARLSFTGAELQRTVWCLLALMGTFLIIAGTNVSNLLLCRTMARRAEFSVRLAMGAGRLRVARQLLVESLSVVGLAAVLGIFFSQGGIRALEQFYLSQLPRINVVTLDWRALGVTCVTSVFAAALIGTAPAWWAGRINLSASLKETAQQHSGGLFQRLFHDGFVVIQVAMAVVLLFGAAMLTQSAMKLLRVDPGLQAKGLYRAFYNTADFMNQDPEMQGREQDRVERSVAFRRLALERLQAIPGVESVAVNDSAGFADYAAEGTSDRVYLGQARVGVVAGDYLRTVGARLVAGRLLNRDDATSGQEGVVINERMASLCWPGQNPLGKRFGQLDRTSQFVVVGVIENILDFHLEAEAQAMFYEPCERPTDSSGGISDYIIRSFANPERLRDELVQAGREMLAPVELNEFYSIETQLYQSTAPRRVMMWLFITMGILGLLLSAIGQYAVMSHAAVLRTREMGVRMALGATRGDVARRVLGHGVRVVAYGAVLGAVVAFALGRFLESLLYRVKPGDPVAFVGAVIILGLVSCVACYLPARRAARVDPMVALRSE